MKQLKNIFLAVSLGLASFGFSQTTDIPNETGEAAISDQYCISLSSSEEIQKVYTADAAELNWESKIHAAKMCGFHSNNLVTLRQDYENGKILIYIHSDRTPEPKDVEWWNTYLLTLCK